MDERNPRGTQGTRRENTRGTRSGEREENVESNTVPMIPLLLYLGGFLQAFGAWGIDFAWNARGSDSPTVGIPTPRGTLHVNRSFFWNFNFFVGIIGGSVLVIVGAMM